MTDMASMIKVKTRDLFMGRLDNGTDLLEELTGICRKENVRLGRIEALGAVEKARLGYYDQQTHEYRFITLDKHLEITKLVGNVSMKDGNPFVHAHITLADKEGNACGGHLAPGTVVFACEFVLEAFDGPILERDFDEATGLALWAIQNDVT
jgi:predicted DNA-binding protein with PD1-like motif